MPLFFHQAIGHCFIPTLLVVLTLKKAKRWWSGWSDCGAARRKFILKKRNIFGLLSCVCTGARIKEHSQFEVVEFIFTLTPFFSRFTILFLCKLWQIFDLIRKIGLKMTASCVKFYSLPLRLKGYSFGWKISMHSMSTCRAKVKKSGGGGQSSLNF